MMKWLQKAKDNMQDENKKKLSKQERYVKKYLKSDKCFNLYNKLKNAKLIKQESTQAFNYRVRQTFPDVESTLKTPLQEQYLKLFEPPTIDIKSPIIAIFAVGFHHKRGSEVEFCFPKITDENILNKVTVYSLPDAVHNTDEDYLYFNFKSDWNGKSRMLFGVTCFKQIKVTDQIKQQDPELTRSHLQKAICLLSLEPLFGYIKNRLEPTIKAYFQLQNFKDTSLIQFAYENISLSMDYKICIHNLEMSEMMIDTNIISIFVIFKDKIFKILKAMMLELKIIVFSLSSSICSKFLITLISLIPGLLQYDIQNKSAVMQRAYLSNYGLPLNLFGDYYQLFMHFSVNDLNEIQKRGYLIGTTNKFLKSMGKLDPDILIDIDAEQMQILKEEHKKLLENKIGDKFVYSQINQGIKQYEPYKEQYKKFNPQNQENVTFYGSDEWIRKIMQDYIIRFLQEMSSLVTNMQLFDQRIEKYQQLRLGKGTQQDNSNSSEEDEPNEKNGIVIDENSKTRHQLIKELEIKEIRSRISSSYKEVSKYNKKWALQWFLNTHNGKEWFIAHDESIQLTQDSFSEDKLNYFLFDNLDLYIGNEQLCAIIELKNKRVFVGKSNKIDRQEGKYESLIDKSYQFKGKFENNKMHGEGQLIVHGDYQYNGHFEYLLLYFRNGVFHGYGNLHKGELVYEGQFKDGIFNGTGKMIMPSHDVYVGLFLNGQFHGEGQYVWSNGDIYSGSFKEGKQQGMGLFQSKEYIYEGEWVQNKKQGFGAITYQNSQIKYQGQFIDDLIDESQQVLIKYPNGRIYQGQIKDLKPHGEGFLADENGQQFNGQFQDGIYQ